MTPSIVAALRPTLAALVLALAFATLAAPRTAHAGPVDDVCAPMQRYAEAASARVGFVVLDLTDGGRCSYHAGEVFRTASLYKLIVLAEAHEQVRLGTFSFDEGITVRQYRAATADRPAGTDVYVVGAREAARRMIQVSDNATAEALAARLQWSAVGAAPARLGMPNTVVGEAYTTTADDIAYFFAELHAGTLVGADEDAAMLDVLRGQRIRDRIPWFLPDDVEIAHKTGRLYAYANDAGIVYAPAGPFVLVLLTESDESLGPGYEAIRNLARIAYEGFDDDPSTPAAAIETTSAGPTAATSEETATPAATPEASAATPATATATPSTEDPLTEDPLTEDPSTEDPSTEDPSTEDSGESSGADADTRPDDSSAEQPDADDTAETVETTDAEEETVSASGADSDADAPKEAAAVSATPTATPTPTVAAAPAPTATAAGVPVASATAVDDRPSPPARASATREPSPLVAAGIAAVAAVAASIGLFALSLGRRSPTDDPAE